jgi:hypothetical protein
MIKRIITAAISALKTSRSSSGGTAPASSARPLRGPVHRLLPA